MIKAFLVGAGTFENSDNTLPCCPNDINEIKKSLSYGLGCDDKNILLLGTGNKVDKADFIRHFNLFRSHLQTDDIAIFYFSGHGKIIDNDHYLLLSDSGVATKDLIRSISNAKAKNTIFIFDTCYSGMVLEDINNSLQNLSSSSIKIIASCKKTEKSYVMLNGEVSTFTWFFAKALCDNSVIRKGKKSLFDIINLTKLYLEVYANHTNDTQNTTYQSLGIYDIYFKIFDWEEPEKPNFSKAFDNYSIVSVEPLHTTSNKRYAAKILLKKPFNLTELSYFSNDIVKELSVAEIYKTDKQKLLWTDKPINVVYLYFSLDIQDIEEGNFLVRAIWVNKNCDYKIPVNYRIALNNIYFTPDDSYFEKKQYVMEHTANVEEYRKQILPLLKEMTTSCKRLIYYFNEFQNGNLTNEDFLTEIKPFVTNINKIFIKSSNLAFPPKQLKLFDKRAMSVFSAGYDLSLVYQESALSPQESVQKKHHMLQLIKAYYDSVEIIKNTSKNPY